MNHHLFKCTSLKNLNCLIYPLPTVASLGIHTVLSLDGSVSFGPNIEILDEAIEIHNKKIGFIIKNSTNLSSFFNFMSIYIS